MNKYNFLIISCLILLHSCVEIDSSIKPNLPNVDTISDGSDNRLEDDVAIISYKAAKNVDHYQIDILDQNGNTLDTVITKETNYSLNLTQLKEKLELDDLLNIKIKVDACNKAGCVIAADSYSLSNLQPEIGEENDIDNPNAEGNFVMNNAGKIEIDTVANFGRYKVVLLDAAGNTIESIEVSGTSAQIKEQLNFNNKNYAHVKLEACTAIGCYRLKGKTKVAN